jgi:hypothetical protein
MRIYANDVWNGKESVKVFRAWSGLSGSDGEPYGYVEAVTLNPALRGLASIGDSGSGFTMVHEWHAFFTEEREAREFVAAELKAEAAKIVAFADGFLA